MSTSGVMLCSFYDKRKHVPQRTAPHQPCIVFTLAQGGRDPEAVLSQYDDWDVNLIGSGDASHNWTHAIRKRGERIGIENHCRSSGSMFSNSASITRSILRFSLWRCFSPPAKAIHGFCRLLVPAMRAIFSDRA